MSYISLICILNWAVNSKRVLCMSKNKQTKKQPKVLGQAIGEIEEIWAHILKNKNNYFKSNKSSWTLLSIWNTVLRRSKTNERNRRKQEILHLPFLHKSQMGFFFPGAGLFIFHSWIPWGSFQPVFWAHHHDPLSTSPSYVSSANLLKVGSAP